MMREHVMKQQQEVALLIIILKIYQFREKTNVLLDL